MFCFGIISTIFAIKPDVSLWGISGRNEGIITIIYYFSLYFITSFIDKKYKKFIVIIILITGVVQFIYAICQKYEVEGVYRMIHRSSKITFSATGFEIKKEIWATGFTTNPNFFGTYMLLCEALVLGLYIQEKNIIKSILYLVLSGVFLYGILISNTMSCFFGFVAVLIYVLVLGIKNKYIKKLIIFSVVIVIATSICVKSGKTRVIKELPWIQTQVTEISKGNVADKMGTYRVYVWRNAINLLPDNWLTGIGIDNFYYAFDGKPLTSKNGRYMYDKVHNEYLQILITEGVFCLITYLVMYGTICIRGLKKTLKNEDVYLFLPVIGYLVQAFFNISVIEVAPIFFIILGLCMSKSEEKSE